MERARSDRIEPIDGDVAMEDFLKHLGVRHEPLAFGDAAPQRFAPPGRSEDLPYPFRHGETLVPGDAPDFTELPVIEEHLQPLAHGRSLNGSSWCVNARGAPASGEPQRPRRL